MEVMDFSYEKPVFMNRIGIFRENALHVHYAKSVINLHISTLLYTNKIIDILSMVHKNFTFAVCEQQL